MGSIRGCCRTLISQVAFKGYGKAEPLSVHFRCNVEVAKSADKLKTSGASGMKA